MGFGGVWVWGLGFEGLGLGVSEVLGFGCWGFRVLGVLELGFWGWGVGVLGF